MVELAHGVTESPSVHQICHCGERHTEYEKSNVRYGQIEHEALGDVGQLVRLKYDVNHNAVAFFYFEDKHEERDREKHLCKEEKYKPMMPKKVRRSQMKAVAI